MKTILNYSLTILFISFLTLSSLAQDDKTTFTEIDKILEVQTQNNFDSLLSIWYVKKSLDNDTLLHITKNADHNLDVSDAIIIERLNKIATPIELTYKEQVRKWITMYLKRGPYLIPTFLGLQKYYFPLFEEILDENDLPLEFKYLPIIESALNPRAVSPAGATGLWQFLYSTGKMYGLEINSFVDERRDPIKSTYAAAYFLNDLYDIYGDWTLCLAAYNCGPGNVNKAIRRSGGKTNFWEIYQYLPRETRGYVPAFIAATYVMTYAEEHNFYPAKIKMPIFTDTIMVNDTLHLLQVAEVLDIPITQLRELNPQYKKDIIPGHVSPYPLRMPLEFTTTFIVQQDEIYAHKDSILFKNRRIISPPTYTASARSGYNYTSSESTPCDEPNLAGKTKLIYTVKSGDTFGFIANWYNISVRDLKCWNDKPDTRLSIGENLTVYVYTKKLRLYSKINTMSFDEKQNKASKQTVATHTTSNNTKLDGNFIYYTIKSGDNIYTIAGKFDGISHSDIMQINGFSDGDVRNLQIGQVIKIKRK